MLLAARKMLDRALAMLVWATLALQMGILVSDSLAPGGHGVLWAIARFFLYFTLLTNTLVGLSLTLPAWRPHSRPGVFFARDSVQAAIMLNILVVGTIYELLLRATWNPQGLRLVTDTLLHDVVPLAYVLRWVFVMPHGRLEMRRAPRWLLYPLAYLAYALGRASIDGVYAYPFIDLSVLGPFVVLRNVVALSLAFVGLAYAVTGLDRWLGRRARSA